MSKIKLTCDSCGELHSVDTSEFDYDAVDSDERQMGTETTYEGELTITCECGAEISVTHRVWEYPEGSPPNHEEVDIDGGTAT